MFVKGNHERQFAYEAHTACDKNGYVLETVVTPGNVHDSVAFDDVYDKVTQTLYKTPHICKKVFTDGRVLSTAYKRPMTMRGGHEWWKYVYDKYYDCVICPEYQLLAYRTTNRDGYREYCSNPKICAQCPTRRLCTRSKNCVKTVLRMFGKTTKNWPMTPDTPRNTRTFTPNAKKPLNGSLRMRKKSMPYAILTTVVWPRFPTG
jgi:uncharacterized Fe-S cluster protein YjdI